MLIYLFDFVESIYERLKQTRLLFNSFEFGLMLVLKNTILHISNVCFFFYFQYGRANIEGAKKHRYEDTDDEEDDEAIISDLEKIKDQGGGGDPSKTLANSTADKLANSANGTPSKKRNGVVNGSAGTQVISRDNLILVPDPIQNYHNGTSEHKQEDVDVVSQDIVEADQQASKTVSFFQCYLTRNLIL